MDVGAERIGEALDVVKRYVALRSLYRSNIRAMQSAQIGQRLLRQVQRLAPFPQMTSESVPCGFVRWCSAIHLLSVRVLTTMGLQT